MERLPHACAASSTDSVEDGGGDRVRVRGHNNNNNNSDNNKVSMLYVFYSVLLFFLLFLMSVYLSLSLFLDLLVHDCIL
jgi:hypothetical protein